MKIRTIVGGLLVWAAMAAATSSADAGLMPRGVSFSMTCANGGNYVLQSGPVAAAGEVITARLFLHPRRPIPVRLVPMGNGYRYAGRGVFLDGIQDRALLYVGKSSPTPCVISPS